MREIQHGDIHTVLKSTRFYESQSIVGNIYHGLVNILKRVLLNLGNIILRQIKQLK